MAAENETTEGGATAVGSAMERVLSGMLRPLVRILIARGITLPALVRLLKTVYVKVAEEDFRLGEKAVTDSRVSVLTGVHRRDVRTIRSGEGEAAPRPARATTMIATVIGRWLASPDYLDPEGAPRSLARTGPAPSFEALAQSVSSDIRPRTVLDELMRQGIVAETADGLIALSTEAFAGPGDPDQKILFFAANVGDHIAAAAGNLFGDGAERLERAVFYNNLSAEDVAALEAEARAEGQALLVRLNRAARERQAVSEGAPEATQRFRFGLYFFDEDEHPKSADVTTEGDPQ
ncbi:MAG: DUF6502 family protein [Pseudomonadota bacterium]